MDFRLKEPVFVLHTSNLRRFNPCSNGLSAQSWSMAEGDATDLRFQSLF